MGFLDRRKYGLNRFGIARIGRRFLLPAGDHERIREKGFFAIAERSFSGLRDLMNGIDERMGRGQIIKDASNSRSTYVARIQVNDWDVMVKRYNHKGLAHSLGRTIQGSRARHNWLHSHLLESMGIPSPRPLAFVEICRGPFVWESYSLCEYVDAESLHDVLERGQAGEDELVDIATMVHGLLTSMWRRRITHGDLKLENILLREGTAVVVDLDQMRVHSSELVYRFHRRRDLAILKRHLCRYPRFEAIFAALEDGQR